MRKSPEVFSVFRPASVYDSALFFWKNHLLQNQSLVPNKLGSAGNISLGRGVKMSSYVGEGTLITSDPMNTSVQTCMWASAWYVTIVTVKDLWDDETC